MPTYRSINIALHSQFDIETLPEYFPPPFSPSLDSSLNLAPSIPPLIDDTTSTCSVHVPVLPGSQFWIAYSVSPPVPEGHYFLFKLYIDGERVVSWSTGKEDGWTGQTMFGLFQSAGSHGGVGEKRRVEKRALCFSVPDRKGRMKDGCVEIRVHRASGRKRVEREVGVFEETKLAKKDGGISLVNAGRAGPEQPKRFYKFALIDPVDQSFATFRYYYRTWEQLRDLGLLDNEYYTESEENDMSVIEPGEDSAQGPSSRDDAEPDKVVHEGPEDVFQADGDGISVHDWSAEGSRQKAEDASKRFSTSALRNSHPDCSSPRRDSIASGSYIPRGAPASEVATGSPQSLRHRGRMDTYRLSMPPAIKLAAPEPTSRPLPLPRKNDFSSSTAYRPHPAYPIEEWTVRTPSPVRSIRDGITTPQLERRKGLGITGTGLMGVISSTWKRSVSGAQAPRKGEPEEGPRSASS